MEQAALGEDPSIPKGPSPLICSPAAFVHSTSPGAGARGPRTVPTNTCPLPPLSFPFPAHTYVHQTEESSETSTPTSSTSKRRSNIKSKGRKTTRRGRQSNLRNERARPLQAHEKVTIGVQRLNVVRQTIERCVLCSWHACMDVHPQTQPPPPPPPPPVLLLLLAHHHPTRTCTHTRAHTISQGRLAISPQACTHAHMHTRTVRALVR